MFDKLLNLIEPSTISAAGAQVGKALGRNRGFTAELRVGGDVVGTGPLTIAIEESTALGTGYAEIARFANVVDEMVGYVGGTTPRYEVPGEDPLRVAFVTTKDYVRANVVACTGTFPLTSVVVVPNDTTVKLSGRA